jgi:hypothetical protein
MNFAPTTMVQPTDDEVVGGGGSKDGVGYKKRKGFNLEVKPFSNL